ncbi:hypothetical protein BD410DRAFT_753898 [Rickenella mellea]|uniref:DDHD domain-containing protein n=1 Tax=Rickenella mellea TaxID=50990 RepID=A0A4Y7PS03_9AGAM|nr:hypothetical protein BD410DRAFT_753898 [Rickenella mellea]
MTPTHDTGVRWLRPQNSSAYLDLPSAPITANTKGTAWQAFTEEESNACEAAWQALTEDERKKALENSVGSSDKELKEKPTPEFDEEDEDTVGVSIAKDRLFEVNVRTMKLKPIYWKSTAPPITVMRAIWMYDEHHPVLGELANKLEEAYKKVKPWEPSYEVELAQAFDLGLELGIEALDKLKQPLDSSSSILFEDGKIARIITNSLTARFFASLLPSPVSSRSGPSPNTFYPGSTVVYRGYDAALSAKTPVQTPTTTDPSAKSETPGSGATADDVLLTPGQEEKDVKEADEKNTRGRKKERAKPFPPVGSDVHEEVTDLVLIIHGIGQGLADQYEGFNFVYAANLFRQVARKQSMSPALSSVMRNRRVQFLPVHWRMNLKPGTEEAKKREDDGLDNEFTLQDITIKNYVPFVRELANNVLIDIPYFMSHHRESMIASVVQQANRIYRLWCARNPGFDTKGRVHIIAHSLGSALVSHVLSNQPTLQSPLSEMIKGKTGKGKAKNANTDTKANINMSDKFLFNTSALFLVGSPLPLFLQINQAPMIARKGRERTMKSPADEALDRVGNFGCLAIDSIYNVFNPSDPVAYLLNPCVDAKKAKELPPSPIKSVNAAFMSTISTRVSKMFEGLPLPPFASSPRNGSPSRPGPVGRTESRYELGGGTELTGTKSERRFAALNPHGTLDFVLPSDGALSGYIDMITAHAAYWADPNFAAFVLAEIFARQEDLARTGLGIDTDL